MPPKKSKVNSLLHFWAKQQEEEAARATARIASNAGIHEVITILDSPLITDAPRARQVTTTTPQPPSWPALVRRFSSDTSTPPDRQPSANITAPPVQLTSDSDLQQWGFDTDTGKVVRYPVNEMIRPYEMESVLKCLAANTCVSLPIGSLADNIVALVFSNFLRWFPRSRAVYCCSSLEAADQMKERCIAGGIPDVEISVVNAYHNFKKMSDVELGRVFITTPQALTKIVESGSSIAADIRCLAIAMDAGEAATKYKKIVGPLVAQRVPFRVIVTHPLIPDSSKKTSSISRRQQMITSLLISQWEELPALDTKFRTTAVPVGLIADYWTDADIPSTSRGYIEDWKAGTMILLTELAKEIVLPNSDPDSCFFLDWQRIIKAASAIDAKCLETAVNCLFLCEAYRYLILHGPRAFYLYCAAILNDNSTSSRAEEIQLLILANKQLSKTFNDVQTDFSYNQDSLCNTTYDDRSLNSHCKYSKLKSYIGQRLSVDAKSMTGVICCESASVARVVCESIGGDGRVDVIMVVHAATIIPVDYNKKCRPTSRMSGIFCQARGDRGLIVVLPVDFPNSLNLLNTACSNGLLFVIAVDRRSICMLETHRAEHVAMISERFEQLRSTDGRLIRAVDEEPLRKTGNFAKQGAVDRYDFKFEPSLIRLDVDAMELRQTLGPMSVDDRGGTTTDGNDVDIAGHRRHGFELSSNEHADYLRRVGDAPLPPMGLFTKRRILSLDASIEPECLSDTQVLWNDSVQLFGDVMGSDLSRRMVQLMAEEPMKLPMGRREVKKYQYEEHPERAVRISHYDQLIGMLDRLLAGTV